MLDTWNAIYFLVGTSIVTTFVKIWEYYWPSVSLDSTNCGLTTFGKKILYLYWTYADFLSLSLFPVQYNNYLSSFHTVWGTNSNLEMMCMQIIWNTILYMAVEHRQILVSMAGREGCLRINLSQILRDNSI